MIKVKSEFRIQEMDGIKLNAIDAPNMTVESHGLWDHIEITRHMGFNLGNAVKYIWRADLKDAAIQDLEKAIWYITDEITLRRSKGVVLKP